MKNWLARKWVSFRFWLIRLVVGEYTVLVNAHIKGGLCSSDGRNVLTHRVRCSRPDEPYVYSILVEQLK